MPRAALYDEDILLWSEQQADVIRELGRSRRDLPNELDIENVAEEIESVGRSELAAANGLLRQILLHLIKLLIEPDATTARHWRAEIRVFHAGMPDRYAPSMRQRINVDDLWRFVRQYSMDTYQGVDRDRVAELPESWPLGPNDLFGTEIDGRALEDQLRQATTSRQD